MPERDVWYVVFIAMCLVGLAGLFICTWLDRRKGDRDG